MTDVMSDAERIAFLKEHDLPVEGETLSAPAKTAKSASQPPAHVPAPASSKGKIVLAPEGVDPQKMPVTDIVFDPRLLDGFPSLEGQGLRAAADYVFALYKANGRDKDRNSLLWRRVGQFISEERRSRETGGHVKEKVKTTKKQREIANLLAHYEVDDLEELAALLEEAKKRKKKAKKAKKKAKMNEAEEA